MDRRRIRRTRKPGKSSGKPESKSAGTAPKSSVRTRRPVPRTRRTSGTSKQPRQEDPQREPGRYARRAAAQGPPVMTIVLICAIALGGLLMLIFVFGRQKSAPGVQAPEAPPAALSFPDPPGHTIMIDTTSEQVRSAGANVVLGIYSYGARSDAKPVMRAGKAFYNHDIAFFVGDHDICRLSLNSMNDDGIISSKVEATDCPLAIFLKNGSEVKRMKVTDYDTVQTEIDNLFHGGVDQRANMDQVLKEAEEAEKR